MAEKENSIENLRIYTLARSLEDQVYTLVQQLPSEENFKLANSLRRASAGVAHYIHEAHKRYSYHIKLESLHGARTEAETAQKLLEDFQNAGFGDTAALREEYTSVIKQTWGLIKYLKNRQLQQQAKTEAAATDQLVAARS